MGILTNLPDLGNAAKLLKISVELEGVKDGGVIGMAIQSGLREKRLRSTLKMIQEQAQDNPKLMAEILGEELLNDCLTVKI